MAAGRIDEEEVRPAPARVGPRRAAVDLADERVESGQGVKRRMRGRKSGTTLRRACSMAFFSCGVNVMKGSDEVAR